MSPTAKRVATRAIRTAVKGLEDRALDALRVAAHCETG
jgi:hypothetical protein